MSLYAKRKCKFSASPAIVRVFFLGGMAKATLQEVESSKVNNREAWKRKSQTSGKAGDDVAHQDMPARKQHSTGSYVAEKAGSRPSRHNG
jgi:hypothetical protein